MIKRPRFRPSFEIAVVKPKHVFLLNEHRFLVVEGEVYPHLVPLLDGQHTVEEILTEIGGQIPFQNVLYALNLLEEKGYIVGSDDSISLGISAFWDYLDMDISTAVRRMEERCVSVRSVGDVSTELLINSLQNIGIQVVEEGNFEVVLTDDYLRGELGAINQENLKAERPWMLVKVMGTVLWLGPVFRAGETGCWACLEQRLAFNRQVESYIVRNTDAIRPLKMPNSMLPATVQGGIDLAAIEIAKWVVKGENPQLDGVLQTMDFLTLQRQEHVLVKRPQCKVCGLEQDRRPQELRSVVLQSRNKGYRGEGGHRVIPPEETFERYKHHISPLIGAVIFVSRLFGDRDNGLAYSYLAGHNFAMGVESVIFLHNTLRGQSGGKGITEIQAKVSALCEALERYSGVYWGEEATIQSTYQALLPEAIHPNDCMQFSEAQYRDREKWNISASKYHIVPSPFDQDLEISWTPIWSLTNQKFHYIPTSYCYYGHPDFGKYRFSSSDSNGCSAGNALEEAILQGLMELVERDAVAIWWYNRISRPPVDINSFGVPYLRELQAYYASINREIWVLDITSDLGIPVFAGVSIRVDKPVEDIILGFGAHLDPRVALLRAITEVNQFLPCVMGINADGSTRYMFPDQGAIEWWQNATIANQPYLTSDEALPHKTLSDYPQLASDDLKKDINLCVEIARDHDLEVLVLDQTRPDIGLNVVKVIVPGLRHFWRRLGPGRLYDVPVKLGWLETPLREDQLNPYSVFF